MSIDLRQIMMERASNKLQNEVFDRFMHIMKRAIKSDSLSIILMNSYHTVAGYKKPIVNNELELLVVQGIAEMIVGSFVDAINVTYMNDFDARAKIMQKMIDDVTEVKKKKDEEKDQSTKNVVIFPPGGKGGV